MVVNKEPLIGLSTDQQYWATSFDKQLDWLQFGKKKLKCMENNRGPIAVYYNHFPYY